jgi:hypothetical protein
MESVDCSEVCARLNLHADIHCYVNVTAMAIYLFMLTMSILVSCSAK